MGLMLTKRRKEVLDFTKTYLEKKGYAPSLQEIQKRFKLASVSTAHFHISKLQNEGYVTKQNGKARSIKVTIPIIGNLIARKPTKKDLNDLEAYFAVKVNGDYLTKYGILDGSIVIVKFKQ